MQEHARLLSGEIVETGPNAKYRDAENPGLRVRRLIEGGYEADFQLVLSGVRSQKSRPQTHHESESEVWVQSGLRALFGTLAQGQEIELGYRWCPAQDGRRPFEWLAAGRCIDRSDIGSRAAASGLYQSLKAIMEVAGFELCAGRNRQQDSTNLLEWHAEIWPLGIRLPCAASYPLGYSARSDSADAVILGTALASCGTALESFTRVGRILGRELVLSIQVYPVDLNAREMDALRAAHDTLCSGPKDAVQFEGYDKGQLVSPSILSDLLRRLELWIGEPRGYRVRCVLAGCCPLPSALTAIIGGDLWGSRVSVREATVEPAKTKAENRLIVRLNDCVHLSEGPPNFLPSSRTAEAFGVPRTYPATAMGFSGQGLLLGHCGPPGHAQQCRISEPDRSRHCYIIGATGTGKSTLINQMVLQDIEQGSGLCLIDPHGDLFEQVLQAIPEHRAGDVILMDLTDFDYSVGLNFLECGGPTKPLQMNFIVNEMIAIFHLLYNMDIAGGPVFEIYMRNALLTVMDNASYTATLMDVVRFFEDSRFRSLMTSRCKSAIAASFWNNQALRITGDNAFANIGPYITSKLNQFTHNALLRPIIGQRNTTIDFRKAMDDGQIVLINLAKGLVGELDMRLLGMLLVGKIVNAAMGRATLPQEARRRFYLYIDEFQTLATPSVIGLLSEARKFGLSLIMANQHLGQLTEDPESRGVAEAILGNVATMLFFRIGTKDAMVLEPYTAPFLDAYDLQRLPDRQVACRMVRNNGPVDPFVMRTLPMREAALDDTERSEVTRSIRQRVRQTYARPRLQVDEEIMRGWVRNDRPGDFNPDI